MRKSSRGNPYHDERGRFCSADRCRVKSERSPEEYEERTEQRRLGTKYYSKDTANDEPTPRQRRFAEAIAKRLGKELPEEETKKGYSEFIAENVDEFYAKKKSKAKEQPPQSVSKPTPEHAPEPTPTVPSTSEKMPRKISSGQDGAIAFTKECARAFGAKSDGVHFYSQARGRKQGTVSGRIVDGRYQATSCNVTSKRNKEYQAHVTYHEVFHLARNGCECERSDIINNRNIEETMAEVSAITMSQDNGFGGVSTAYSQEIIHILPRLKQTEKYKNCKTMSDFGRIFIANRKQGNVSLKYEADALKQSRFRDGEYLAQYQEEANKHFDFVYKEGTRPKDRGVAFYAMLKAEHDSGFALLKQGKAFRTLSSNQKILISATIRRAMERKGIL